jgi:hypothetical protein
MLNNLCKTFCIDTDRQCHPKNKGQSQLNVVDGRRQGYLFSQRMIYPRFPLQYLHLLAIQ